jgi:hypothetical protein
MGLLSAIFLSSIFLSIFRSLKPIRLTLATSQLTFRRPPLFLSDNMPITLQSELRRASQEEFGQIAYDVTDVIFDVHHEFGRFLEEDIYRTTIAQRLKDAQAEFAVKVDFDSFAKSYDLEKGGGKSDLTEKLMTEK